MNDGAISRSISKFIDKPHAVGDRSKGWDCVNSLFAFYRDMGVELPMPFEDFTEENYPEKWKKDSHRCRKALERFITALGEKIEFSFMRRGDLLIFKTNEFPAFPGIYLGNGHIMIVVKEGARVVPLQFFEKFLVDVRRLIS